MTTGDQSEYPQTMSELQDGYVPGGRAKLRNRVIFSAVLLGFVIFGVPIIAVFTMFTEMMEPRTFGHLMFAFNNGEQPSALVLEQTITLIKKPNEPDLTKAILASFKDGNVETDVLLDDSDENELTPYDIDAIFSIGGNRYIAVSEHILSLALDGQLEDPVTFDGFVLAVCADADLAWILIKNESGLAIARFDGQRLSSPIPVDNTGSGIVGTHSRHHAAILPLGDAWLVLSGTDTSAKYKYLPMTATESWASIPWKALPLKTNTWTAFTHYGRPRLLVTDMSEMLNPLKAAFVMWGSGNLSGELYELKDRNWELERRIDVPGFGQFAGAADRRGLPAALFMSAPFKPGNQNVYMLDLNDSGPAPWKQLPMSLGQAIDMQTPVRLGIAGALGILLVMVVVVLFLNRAMRRYRVARIQSDAGNIVEYASLLQRGLARFVDLLIVMIPGYGGMLLILPIWNHGVKLDEVGTLIRFFAAAGFGFTWIYVVPLIFWSVLETRTGQTPGKWLLRINVVDLATFGRPTFKAAFVRNVLLIVEAVSYGVVALMMIPLSRFRQRVGDVSAKTIVIRDRDQNS
jgi:uncharacterized RDD family membrane protein YckC